MFDAVYASLHVRVSNRGAFHLYTQTLGYEYVPLHLQGLPDFTPARLHILITLLPTQPLYRLTPDQADLCGVSHNLHREE